MLRMGKQPVETCGLFSCQFLGAIPGVGERGLDTSKQDQFWAEKEARPSYSQLYFAKK